jgi:hypothetical protein
LIEDASEDFSNIEEHISMVKKAQLDSVGQSIREYNQEQLNYLVSYQSRQQALKSNL